MKPYLNLLIGFLILAIYPQYALAMNWSYEGKYDPTYWEYMSHKCATCEKGDIQSPIDRKAITRAEIKVSTDYLNGSACAINNYHTIQINIPLSPYLTNSSEAFSLLKSKTEYTLDSTIFPLAEYFIHQSRSKEVLSVLGVLFAEEKFNKTLQNIINTTPLTSDNLTATKKRSWPENLAPKHCLLTYSLWVP